MQAKIRDAQRSRVLTATMNRITRQRLAMGWNKWAEVFQHVRQKAVAAQHQSQLTGQAQSYGQRVARMQQGQQQMIVKTVSRMQTDHAAQVRSLSTTRSSHRLRFHPERPHTPYTSRLHRHLLLQLAERDNALRTLLAQNAELKASHERALKAQTGSFRAELDKMGSSHAEMVEVVENENAAAKQKVV